MLPQYGKSKWQKPVCKVLGNPLVAWAICRTPEMPGPLTNATPHQRVLLNSVSPRAKCWASLFLLGLLAFNAILAGYPFGSNTNRPYAGPDLPSILTSQLPLQPATDGRHALALSGTTLSQLAYTLIPTNNTLLQGQYSQPVPNWLSGATFDPTTGQVFIGENLGGHLFGINASSDRLESTIYTNWGSYDSVYDSTDGSLIVETYYGLFQFNPKNGSIIKQLSGPGGPAGQGTSGLAYDPETREAYLADFSSGTVRVINVSTGQSVANISVGPNPQSLAFDPTDRLLYVGDVGDSSLTVVNTSSDSVLVRGISLGGTPGNGNSYPYPNCMVYDPENGYIYVGNQVTTNTTILVAATHGFVPSNLSTGGCLSMLYDPANGHVYVGSAAGHLADINGTTYGSSGVYGPDVPDGLAYDARDNLVFTANSGDTTLTSFNASTGAIVRWRIDITDTFLQSAYDPVTGDIWAATPDPGSICTSTGMVTIIDPSAHPRVVDSVTVGTGPRTVAVATRSDIVFVANACSNNVTLLDGLSHKILVAGAGVGSFPAGLGYDSVNDQVWVANAYSNNVTVLNGSTGALVKAGILVGQVPSAVAFDPVNRWVYIANYGSNNVSVLNGSTLATARAPIPVGSSPDAIAFDPTDNTILVANGVSNNLTVLNASTGAILRPDVPAGDGPVALALDAADARLYIADANGATLATLNLSSYALVGAPLPTGGDPQSVAYDPLTQQVEVGSFSSGTISVFATVPTIASAAFLPNSADVGNATWLRTNASEAGGAPLGFGYMGLPPGCLPTNLSDVSCVPTSTGDYRPLVTVTDPRGYAAWRYVSLHVDPTFASATLSVNRSTVDVGQAMAFTASTSGGGPPMRFVWWGLPPGCASQNVSTLICLPSAAGTYAVTVQATDGAGVTRYGSVTVTVEPALNVAAFLMSPWNPQVGSPTTLTTVVLGGTEPLTFVYQGLPPGCASQNSSSLSCTPNATGRYHVTAEVTDRLGVSANASATLVVQNLTYPPLVVDGFFVDPIGVNVGNSTTFYTVASGGESPLTYAYQGLPAGCSTESTPQLTCAPTGLGTFDVTVLVTDARGVNASAITQVVVDRAPSPGPGPTHGSGNTTTAPFPWATMILAGAIGAVVGGLAGVVLTRCQRRGPGPEGAPDEARQTEPDRGSSGP